MNKFYTAQEIADKLKIKKNTVYELIKRGELSSSKVGKQLRVSEEQLQRALLPLFQKGAHCLCKPFCGRYLPPCSRHRTDRYLSL